MSNFNIPLDVAVIMQRKDADDDWGIRFEVRGQKDLLLMLEIVKRKAERLKS